MEKNQYLGEYKKKIVVNVIFILIVVAIFSAFIAYLLPDLMKANNVLLGSIALGVVPAGLISLWPIASLISNYQARKLLASYMSLDAAWNAFQNELQEQGLANKGMHTLTKSWVYTKKMTEVSLMPLDKIVWCYGVVVQRRYNGIKTGKTFSVNCCYKKNFILRIEMLEEQMLYVMATIRAANKHAVIGYSDQKKQAWKRAKSLNEWYQLSADLS